MVIGNQAQRSYSLGKVLAAYRMMTRDQAKRIRPNFNPPQGMSIGYYCPSCKTVRTQEESRQDLLFDFTGFGSMKCLCGGPGPLRTIVDNDYRLYMERAAKGLPPFPPVQENQHAKTQTSPSNQG